MRENTPIDGYPENHDRRLHVWSHKRLARRVMYKLVDHYVTNNGKDGIVTWVDTEEAWDGHALAVKEIENETFMLKYFHVNRDKSTLLQQATLELPAGDVEDEKADREETIRLIEEATRELDKEDLKYVFAMLGKAARVGVGLTPGRVDKTVLGVLFDENLDELASLFPEKSKKEIHPYASPEFISAVSDLVKTNKELQQPEAQICLVKNFPGNISYGLSLKFIKGMLSCGHFLQRSQSGWEGYVHNYADSDPEPIDGELKWDADKLIITVRRGVSVSCENFDIYAGEAYAAVMEKLSAIRDVRK